MFSKVRTLPIGAVRRVGILADAARTAESELSMMKPFIANTNVANAPATQVTQLVSGARVASECTGGETATVAVCFDAGSRYETEKTSGAAHVLDHMRFKGTNKRTQQQLQAEIGKMGGQLNACTSREHTMFSANVFKQDVPRAMEIMSDIITNAKLDDAAINQERDVILRKMGEVSHEEQIMDHLHETAFMGTGLGHSLLSQEENIRKLSNADLTDYIQTHYTAPRVVITGAGAVDHTELSHLTEQHFGKLPSGTPGKVDMDPAVFTGADKRIRFDSMKEAHVAVAFEGASWTSEHAVPLQLMQTVLGSWDRTAPGGRNLASRLARQLSEQELVHSFSSFNLSYKDSGLFGVQFVAEDNKLDDSMWNVLHELVRLCHDVTDEELRRAKTQLKGSMMMQVASNSGICEDIGRQMLTHGRRMTHQDMFHRIDSVSLDDLKNTANKFINDEDHALSAVGPIYELPDYNWIRRRSFWHRY